MLWSFLVYSKVIPLYKFMCLFFFKFFPHLGCYIILNRVLCYTADPYWLCILNTAMCTCPGLLSCPHPSEHHTNTVILEGALLTAQSTFLTVPSSFSLVTLLRIYTWHFQDYLLNIWPPSPIKMVSPDTPLCSVGSECPEGKMEGSRAKDLTSLPLTFYSAKLPPRC